MTTFQVLPNIFDQFLFVIQFKYLHIWLQKLLIFSGNHESINMNQMYGFDGEVKNKYPFSYWPLYFYCNVYLFHLMFNTIHGFLVFYYALHSYKGWYCRIFYVNNLKKKHSRIQDIRLVLIKFYWTLPAINFRCNPLGNFHLILLPIDEGLLYFVHKQKPAGSQKRSEEINTSCHPLLPRFSKA